MFVSVQNGDARFQMLKKALLALGCRESTMDEADVIVVPKGGNAEEAASAARKDALILLAGAKPAGDAREVNIMQDELYLLENAVLTAEGAIFYAMQRMDTAISASKCMVIGYGRIGRTLCGMLYGLGARVTLASSHDQPRKIAAQKGYATVRTSAIASVISGQNVVFSTPPFPVITREVLENVNPETLLIDLASPPYGIDFQSAEELGIKVYLESGVPGRYCPAGAAHVLEKAVLRILNEKGMNI